MSGKNTFFLEINAEKRYFFWNNTQNRHLKRLIRVFYLFLQTWKRLLIPQYIHALIAEGEHQQQDFKFEISDARKIAKTLSAFSNTDGGRLLIGVKDNGKIAGVRSDEEQYMIEAAAPVILPAGSELQHTDLSGRRPQRIAGANRWKRPQTGICQGRNGKISCLSPYQGWEHPCHSRPSTCLATKRKSQGELMEYTEREQLLLDLLDKRPVVTEPLLPSGTSVTPCCRASACQTHPLWHCRTRIRSISFTSSWNKELECW